MQMLFFKGSKDKVLLHHVASPLMLLGHHCNAGIILCMRPANERRCYIVMSSLIGWAHTQNDPWKRLSCHAGSCSSVSRTIYYQTLMTPQLMYCLKKEIQHETGWNIKSYKTPTLLSDVANTNKWLPVRGFKHQLAMTCWLCYYITRYSE